MSTVLSALHIFSQLSQEQHKQVLLSTFSDEETRKQWCNNVYAQDYIAGK